MNDMLIPRGRAALFLAAALFVVPACNDAGDDSQAQAMAQLVDQVKASQRASDQVASRLDKLERKMDGFRQDVDRLGREKLVEALDIQNAASTSTLDDDAALAAASAMGGDDIAAALETENGQAAVAKAMEEIERKKNDERRQRMVTGLVDAFAEQANLSAGQRDDVSRILGGSMQKIGDVWSSMRNMGDMTADQRGEIRDQNMAKMEEIRVATDDEMKGVLDSDQFAIYEEQSQRMRGFGGRGGGGAGGRAR